MSRRKVYIHTNAKQRVRALLARHTLERNSRHPDRFEVEIITAESFGELTRQEGGLYLCANKRAVWRNDATHSSAPLRFAIPELMGYQGRAVVIDPDVLALGDINELLDADMDGAAVLARRMETTQLDSLPYPSSVMLLDCGQLTHWQLERDFAKVFTGDTDYHDWMRLRYEPPGSVGTLAPAWNDFGRLTSATKLLHSSHRQHPDPAQERLFLRMLLECLHRGTITEAQLRTETRQRHLRAAAVERVRAVRKPALVYAFK